SRRLRRTRRYGGGAGRFGRRLGDPISGEREGAGRSAQRVHVMALRLVLGALLGIVLSALPAFALSPGGAKKVVELVEKLEPEHGKIAYDEEEADQWFEDDSAGAGLIGKAGFSREGWKAAFDAVLQGYIALVPQGEIDAKLGAIKARLANT